MSDFDITTMIPRSVNQDTWNRVDKAKATIQQHIAECNARIVSTKQLLVDMPNDPAVMHELCIEENFRDGLERALKHMADAKL